MYFIAKEILGPRYTTSFFQSRDRSGTTLFRADRSLGAKQEGLAIVHFCICLNTLKIPILDLIQRERENLLMVSESRFEALNGGSAN